MSPKLISIYQLLTIPNTLWSLSGRYTEVLLYSACKLVVSVQYRKTTQCGKLALFQTYLITLLLSRESFLHFATDKPTCKTLVFPQPTCRIFCQGFQCCPGLIRGSCRGSSRCALFRATCSQCGFVDLSNLMSSQLNAQFLLTGSCRVDHVSLTEGIQS